MGPLHNPFKAALKAGRLQIGLWQALANPYTAEICAGAGFDWLLFDGEHAPNDVPLLLSQLQAVAPYPTHAVARPPIGETHLVKQYLDIGFTTLLIPMVDTAEHAEALVRAVRYPPEGVRGVGSGIVRASRFNRIPGYLQDADAEICLLVQVETLKGVKNLDAIAAVEGIDGVFIGPADLSAAMGLRGQPGHPDVQAAIESSLARIRAAGKAAGILLADEALARRAVELGFTFVAVGTDVSLLARSTSELAARFGAAATQVTPGGTY
ncbi:MAG TPA: 4-hydroxy-2-oxoheptanedioate aldolase [Caulobacteraceae bacterium]|jgi:4-hydroxy-2-oxoheptanedioate aldolase|nr:4-hydroxy-2-oxoheptanedioate aldolase [Caulobacteraceae bacterium]